MSLAHVLLNIAPYGQRLLYAGGIIGRSPTCAFFVPDPAVSEAHALISARGQALWVLGLRQALRAAGVWTTKLILHRDLVFELVPGVEVQVTGVSLPASRLAVSVDGGPPRPLEWSPFGLDLSSADGIVPFDAARHGRVWIADGRHFLDGTGGPPRELAPGDEIAAEGHVLRVVEVTSEGTDWTSRPGPEIPTAVQLLRADPALVLVQDANGREVVLTGRGATLVVVVAEAGSIDKQRATVRVLGRGGSVERLESQVLYQLRKRLRGAGLRADVVATVDGMLSLGVGVLRSD